MKVAAHEKLNHANELQKIQHLWKEIEVPTLHVQGAKDWLAPMENADFVKEKFNQEYTEVMILEKSSHFIPFTKREWVIQLILERIKN